MSLCYRVPNPCKICLQTVTSRTGIQCQGVCKCWVHYECLNYTPGKIRDVEMGIIKVTCPCPDCKSGQPKEFLADPPFACDNIACPANNPPCCDQPDCIANIQTRCRTPLSRQPGSLRMCAPGICEKYQPNRVIESPCSDYGPYADHTERDLCIQFTDPTAGDYDDPKTGDYDDLTDDPKTRLIRAMAKEVVELTAQINELRSKIKDDDHFSRDQNSYNKKHTQCASYGSEPNQDEYSDYTSKASKSVQIESEHDMFDGEKRSARSDLEY